MDPLADDQSMRARCADCRAPLAPDQRYCVVCGARRGPLPAAVAALLGAPVAARAASMPPVRGRLPSPRVAAVAVMSLLAFGVLIGSSVTPRPIGSRASVALVSPPVPALAAAAPPAPAAPAVEVPPVAPVTTEPTAPAVAPAATKKPPGAGTAKVPPADPSHPAIKHVFLIVLSGHGYDEAFGATSQAPYLAKTLTARGELLANYHGVAQGELANEIALISGQGPTLQTSADCPVYADVAPATIDKDGQVAGDGCVYPAKTQTLADQLTGKGLSWKAYAEGVAGGPPLPAGATCRHPVLGGADGEQAPRAGDPYVTWRNPFVYFHSLVDGEGCGSGIVGLDELATDSEAAKSAPSVAYIIPDRCHDGADEPCAAGQPAGLAAADSFLKTLVPQIEASAAYRDGGLIAITFDRAPLTGPDADSTSCCDAPTFPNLPAAVPRAAPADPGAAPPPAAVAADVAPADPAAAPVTPIEPPADAPAPADTPAAAPAPAPPPAAAPPPAPAATSATGEAIGGGKVGLLLISSFVKPGSVNTLDAFNHFSLLRSIEDIFGLDRLGYAADPALPAFDKAVYNAKAK